MTLATYHRGCTIKSNGTGSFVIYGTTGFQIGGLFNSPGSAINYIDRVMG